MVPFATSVGAILFQVAIFVPLCWLATVLPRRSTISGVLFVAWYLVPLVSVAGITSAIKQLKKKERVMLAGAGLLLNLCYLAGFVLITISAATSPRAWEF